MPVDIPIEIPSAKTTFAPPRCADRRRSPAPRDNADRVAPPRRRAAAGAPKQRGADRSRRRRTSGAAIGRSAAQPPARPKPAAPSKRAAAKHRRASSAPRRARRQGVGASSCRRPVEGREQASSCRLGAFADDEARARDSPNELEEARAEAVHRVASRRRAGTRSRVRVGPFAHARRRRAARAQAQGRWASTAIVRHRRDAAMSADVDWVDRRDARRAVDRCCRRRCAASCARCFALFGWVVGFVAGACALPDRWRSHLPLGIAGSRRGTARSPRSHDASSSTLIAAALVARRCRGADRAATLLRLDRPRCSARVFGVLRGVLVVARARARRGRCRRCRARLGGEVAALVPWLQAACACAPLLPQSMAPTRLELRLPAAASVVRVPALTSEELPCAESSASSPQSPVNQLLYDALLLLQHRGQDAAGIVTDARHARSHMHKARGMVRDVFRTRNMRDLPGNVGIGHVRYPTAGNAYSEDEAQPFYVNAPFGIVLGHNGNLTNAEALKRELFRHRPPPRQHRQSDSEVLLNVLAHELERAARDVQRSTRRRSSRAVAGVHRRCRGAYAVVALIAGHGLLAFRDPYGIRPLVFGATRPTSGTEVHGRQRVGGARGHSASRCCATSRPGEAMFIDLDGQVPRAAVRRRTRAQSRASSSSSTSRGPTRCIDGISVYAGAPEHGRDAGAARSRRMPARSDIDVVIPIPDSSRPSAMQLAQQLGMHVPRRLRQEPLRRPHLHHAGAGRCARRSVRQKLNAIGDRVQGQERAAGRRLDRARHDLARDRADGARGRRAQGVSSPRPRRRCASRTSTASTCRPATSWSRTAAPIEEIARDHRRRRADLPGPRRDEARRSRAVEPAARRASRPRASTATTSPAT